MTLPKVLRVPAWAVFRSVSRLNLRLRGGDFRYIFILGHMRSGSTLLAHILANHPEIVGAGEMHIHYRAPRDLSDLVLKTCEYLHRPVLHAPYIVDQINHDYVADEVLLSPQIYRCIILLRDPEATLQSMAALKQMNDSSWQESEAVKNYANRLRTLRHYGQLLKHRAIVIEYDDLIDDTNKTLATLTNFLGLKSPLKPNYTTHRMTGRIAGHGDPSKNIKSGQVVRTPKHDIAIGKEALIAARSAFRECQDQLRMITTSKADTMSRSQSHPPDKKN
jgi:sulfotransferase family protein